MKKIRFHPATKSEYDRAISYYHRQRAGLGLDFQTEVERIVSMIQENPRLGGFYASTRFRYHLANRFPYLVVFLEREDAIWIMAVAHGRRRPAYWRRRRPE